ncbi:MAG: hypothetical protein JKX73_08115, partial [Flavobacteriales bacterium]|nr:hypothetical protein [Flavobacteriales bacterium]
ASGDGGALNNNRAGVPYYVRKTRMGSKDYSFRVDHIIPRPSATAVLKYIQIVHKGDTHDGKLQVTLNSDAADGFITIPWEGKSDLLVLARTLYMYWDLGNGKDEDYAIDKYKVKLKSLKFRKMKEVFGKSRFRVFVAVNGTYLFLNEFVDVPNILSDGLGYTKKRKWDINQEFMVYLPRGEGQNFRVHAGGWEADVIDDIMATLMDPYSPCDGDIKNWVNEKLGPVSPLKKGGCLDDHIGEIHDIHSSKSLQGDQPILEFESFTDGRKEIDFCPCDNGKQKNVFKLIYSIEKVN